MARSLINSNRTLAFTIVLTLAVALLPPSALGWTRLPAEIFGLVLNPFAVVGSALGNWIRPPQQLSSSINPEYVKLLEEQMVEFERLYLAEQSKATALEQQLEQLQGFPSDSLKTPVQPISARVGLRSPGTALGTVILNRGSNHGVKPRTIAVYNHVHLLGQVTEDVAAVQCHLLPLAHPNTGPLDCLVLPKDHSKVALADAPKIQLTPRGDGSFVGHPDRLKIINPGDEVRSFGDDWPPSAKGMIVGVVESVKPNDMEPLRNTVVVRPTFHVSQLAYVTLRIELEDGQTAAAGGKISVNTADQRKQVAK